jgi:polysaccharide export outer membrane protein
VRPESETTRDTVRDRNCGSFRAAATRRVATAAAWAAWAALAGCAGTDYAPRYADPVYAARPAPQTMTFRLQVGDRVKVNVWKEDDLESVQSIQADGTIAPPLLGSQKIVGLTVDEARGRVADAYREYLIEPKVSLNVVSILSNRVFVLGEVKEPQAVPMKGATTALECVALAGGFEEEYAEKSRIRVVRRGPDGSPVVLPLDGAAVLAGLAPDVPLQRGDIVYVPARGVTNWARSVGQALEPLGTAIGAAGTVATSYALLQD